ncbi:uncharacterized protein LOC107405107 isoform X2 [Ziziphus jujuba]|uniref:Uncharacterized protein LOC107405107 isoform X2 n=2 Tax=Ziziphus jujuba TaxID=326968 RepID=A0ABM3I9B2_ZIZJJ|nr:uncharacterized protein LOC107405107 isoform X2 [Ziziphus jujuba]KAH7542516.1 hypothetical protein FEM48_Zijuj02G0082200 [Ziziphus jujuba var. spinosa]
MEELGSAWSYQENIDELKQKLLYTTIELESVKLQAKEQIRKSEENVKNLLDLLNVAYKERDEARDQLQKLFNRILPSSPAELPAVVPHPKPESPLLMPAKAANSSITESNSLSETYNQQSHGSSPVDSFFDAVSSPDFSTINMADSSTMAFVKQQFVQDYNASLPTGLVSSTMAKTDPSSAVIDNLVKGKILPQKGKLLQAVMESGPLLQTLLVAGPLPMWRNPPPVQPFKIPPVSIKGCETGGFNQKPVENPCYIAQNSLNSFSYPEMSRGHSQTCSASLLSFNGRPSSSCLNNSRLLTSSSSFGNQIPIGKRQRLQ